MMYNSYKQKLANASVKQWSKYQIFIKPELKNKLDAFIPIISRNKSFKPFRVRKMGQMIPEFNQNNGGDAMDDQLNLDNEN